jgi:short-subunit dehydrogenase
LLKLPVYVGLQPQHQPDMPRLLLPYLHRAINDIAASTSKYFSTHHFSVHNCLPSFLAWKNMCCTGIVLYLLRIYTCTMQQSYIPHSFARSTYLLLLSSMLFLLQFLTGCYTAKLGSPGQEKVSKLTYVIVGASSGFGRGVAEQLGAYKANVVVAARRTDLLNEIVANIKAAGGHAVPVTMDISKPEDVQRLADTAVSLFGKVDVWINMAGVGAIGAFWNIPLADQARMVDINYKGIIYGSYAAVNQFRKQGHGVLINMGSIESESPLAYHATYAGTKGAVLRMGSALHQELRLNGYKNIKVVTIEPWAFDTPFWTHAANYSGGTPRMAAMDKPHKVVNAVIRKSLRPKREVAVATKGKLTKFFHRLAPRLTERMSANIVHRYQIKTAPPAPDTPGSLYKPVEAGRQVDGGVEERMKKEKQERKLRKKNTKQAQEHR